MDWRVKIALVVVVIGAGLAAALQFRKHGGAISESSSVAPAETSAADDPQSKPPAAQNAVPYRSTLLDHLGEPKPNLGAVSNDANSTVASVESTDTSSQSNFGIKDKLVDLNAPQQIHKVVDGDTLPQLAQQYLGRSDRYLEIFDYNRDVLQSPDVLPIGAELRIPSPLAAPAGDVANTKSAASPTAANTAAPAAPLVPLIAPTAKPASTQRSGPRTYKVQPGDNLVDIARKLYGDGRRHQDLYEANRSAMRNPGDLTPGMVLTVP